MFDNLTSVPLEKANLRWFIQRNYYGAYIIQSCSGLIVLTAHMFVTSTYSANGCRLWLDLPNGQHAYSYGKASGYGYDRESTALVYALIRAGVDKDALHEAGIQGGIGTALILDKLIEILDGDFPRLGGFRRLYIGV